MWRFWEMPLILSAAVSVCDTALHPVLLNCLAGSGAAFAFEDGYVLAKAVKYAQEQHKPLRYALTLLDETRSPYYADLYKVCFLTGGSPSDALWCTVKELDRMISVVKEVSSTPNLNFHERVARQVAGMWKELGWIHNNDVEEQWLATVARQEALRSKDHGGAFSANGSHDIPNAKRAEVKTNGVETTWAQQKSFPTENLQALSLAVK
jgi:salicylate hydroxylase